MRRWMAWLREILSKPTGIIGAILLVLNVGGTVLDMIGRYQTAVSIDWAAMWATVANAVNWTAVGALLTSGEFRLLTTMVGLALIYTASPKRPDHIAPVVGTAPLPTTTSGHLSPVTIWREIRDRLPLERDDACRNYRGLPLDCVGTLGSIMRSTRGENLVGISIHCPAPGGVGPSVSACVSLEDYPQLRVLHQGSTMRLIGYIENVDLGGFEIHLKDGARLVL
jgi:hypothetical protein